MTSTDTGLLVLRVGVGGVLAAHGAQKLFGWFGGRGLSGTAAGFEAMGFRPGRLHAIAAGLGETAGGGLLAAGLATPLAGAAAAGTMAVAASTHGPNGFFAAKGGWEYPAVLGIAAGSLAMTGPGAYSLDRPFGSRLNRPWLGALVGALSLGGAVAIIRRRQAAVRRPPAGPAPSYPAEPAAAASRPLSGERSGAASVDEP